eukprot:ANDGO_04787.mRNA.1 Condensin complex subunit 2
MKSKHRISSVSQEVILEENDDVKELMNSPPTKLRTASSAGSQQTSKMPSVEVSKIYSDCVKLSTEDKITSKNAWQLSLVDYIEDVISSTVNSGDFNIASATLDASVKIYSHRVDSVHNQTCKLLSGLSRSKSGYDENGEDESDDDANEKSKPGASHSDDEEGGESQRPKKRAKMSFTDTLEESFGALNLKKVESSFDVDPLFARMSKMFDAAGAHGMLLVNLPMTHSGTVMFDSSTLFFDRNPNFASTGDFHGSQNVAVRHPKMSTASRDEDDAAVEDPRSSDSKSPVFAPSTAHGGSDSVITGVDTEPKLIAAPEFGFEDDVASVASDHEDNEEAVVGMNDDRDGRGQSYGDEELGFGASGDSVPADNAGSAEDPMNVVFSFMGSKSDQHWKFRRSQRAAAQRGEREGMEAPKTDVPKPKKLKKKYCIDFSVSVSQAELQKMFSQPRSAKTLLASFAEELLLLPEKSDFEDESLTRLFLKPKLSLHSRQQLSVQGGSHGAIALEDEGSDVDAEGFGMDDDFAVPASASSFSSPLQNEEPQSDLPLKDMDAVDDSLVPVPESVQVESVTFDTTARVVDVKSLKEKIWKSVSKKEDLLFSDLPQTSFSPNESIALRFICLLHLANEHGLRLEGVGMEDIQVHR